MQEEKTEAFEVKAGVVKTKLAEFSVYLERLDEALATMKYAIENGQAQFIPQHHIDVARMNARQLISSVVPFFKKFAADSMHIEIEGAKINALEFLSADQNILPRMKCVKAILGATNTVLGHVNYLSDETVLRFPLANSVNSTSFSASNEGVQQQVFVTGSANTFTNVVNSPGFDQKTSLYQNAYDEEALVSNLKEKLEIADTEIADLKRRLEVFEPQPMAEIPASVEDWIDMMLVKARKGIWKAGYALGLDLAAQSLKRLVFAYLGIGGA